MIQTIIWIVCKYLKENVQGCLRTPFRVWNYTKMIAFIIATKKELLPSLLENVDEEKLMTNEAVRNANLLNEAIRTSFKMKKQNKNKNKKNKKMFGINQTKQFKS